MSRTCGDAAHCGRPRNQQTKERKLLPRQELGPNMFGTGGELVPELEGFHRALCSILVPNWFGIGGERGVGTGGSPPVVDLGAQLVSHDSLSHSLFHYFGRGFCLNGRDWHTYNRCSCRAEKSNSLFTPAPAIDHQSALLGKT
jgi:hypothetical protein